VNKATELLSRKEVSQTSASCYEGGVADGMNKEVVVVARDPTVLRVDIAHRRVITYDDGAAAPLRLRLPDAVCLLCSLISRSPLTCGRCLLRTLVQGPAPLGNKAVSGVAVKNSVQLNRALGGVRALWPFSHGGLSPIARINNVA
jgi:hypothetical protein